MEAELSRSQMLSQGGKSSLKESVKVLPGEMYA
jgi:hypothetical protein